MGADLANVHCPQLCSWLRIRYDYMLHFVPRPGLSHVQIIESPSLFIYNPHLRLRPFVAEAREKHRPRLRLGKAQGTRHWAHFTFHLSLLSLPFVTL